MGTPHLTEATLENALPRVHAHPTQPIESCPGHTLHPVVHAKVPHFTVFTTKTHLLKVTVTLKGKD